MFNLKILVRRERVLNVPKNIQAENTPMKKHIIFPFSACRTSKVGGPAKLTVIPYLLLQFTHKRYRRNKYLLNM